MTLMRFLRALKGTKQVKDSSPRSPLTKGMTGMIGGGVGGGVGGGESPQLELVTDGDLRNVTWRGIGPALRLLGGGRVGATFSLAPRLVPPFAGELPPPPTRSISASSTIIIRC